MQGIAMALPMAYMLQLNLATLAAVMSGFKPYTVCTLLQEQHA